jgi:F-type H+-transporting ATPase subunit b
MLTVSYGTMIWMSIAFIAVLFLLKKFAWKPILQAIKDREDHIEESLQMATKVKSEMKELQSSNEKLLLEARTERDNMLKDARATKDEIIDEAKSKASDEANKMIANAKEAIENEKMAALTHLKNEVGKLSLEIAEKIIRERLSDDANQNELVAKLLKEVNLEQ